MEFPVVSSRHQSTNSSKSLSVAQVSECRC